MNMQHELTDAAQEPDEAVVDMAMIKIAIRHVATVGINRYGGVGRRNPLEILPDLLLQDACGSSDEEFYADWPRPDLPKILQQYGPKKK